MGKYITLTDKSTGKVYTLEFNRRAIEVMERQGFVITEIDTKPATMIPMLFRGAFMMHHPTVGRDVIDALYDAIPDKRALIEKLTDMYSEPLLALISDSEADEGNVEWGASF